MNALTDALIRENLVTPSQIEDARDKQLGAKKPVHELLVDMGFLREEDLVRVSSKVFNMPVSDLGRGQTDPSVLKFVPYETAKKYNVFPLRSEEGKLVLVMSNPQDVVAMDDVSILAKMPVRPVLGTRKEITRAIEEGYQSDESLYDLLKNIVTDTKVKVIKEERPGKETLKLDKSRVADSPVVKLVDLILSDALRNRSSDIHIEPQEHVTEIRYRIDGELRKVMEIPSKLHAPLVVRIKVVSELDIAESKKPQDGRMSVVVGDRKVDVRISMVPTYYGEKIVLRLLGAGEALTELETLGLDKAEKHILAGTLKKPQGMLLVTGPTGSGKTSTLYAALNSLKSETKNIITIEDPIEYLIEGINQMQVNAAKDMTFANGLRSILRQDPNVILVGEIRDKETAEIAFRAALTGHLVFSTLHTNNAASTVTRLLDIGLEPYLVSSSVSLVVAQRLVRLICPECREEYTPEAEVLERFGPHIGREGIRKFFRGKGCEKCAFTGFMGRTGIFEMLEFTEEIRELVSSGASEDKITSAAAKAGMKMLVESGIRKVAEGVTTIEEVARVVDIEAGDHPPVVSGAAKRERPMLLVADDEDDMRKILVKRLETEGYQVITAINGKEAVELATREKPDLVIMDVMMPEMDGFEATRALRSSLETAVIPVLMLTAKRDSESELAGLDAGADDYITKPFDKDKLLARIRMLLKRVNR